ncbi:gliding motility lipoprotein GldB [Sphingobacterium sp. LRF_L2]|uniref:gliding motility lipoprotein GldB n=1 Tax=Sphingobacterium sp. LRF_L2 TaxID=3369421 RepID=UPI003F5EC9D6
MNIKKTAVLLLIPYLLLIGSCSRSKKLPDVSAIPVSIKIERFDQALAQLQPNEIGQSNKEWQKAYGNFYSDYMQYMLEVGDPKDSIQMQQLLSIILNQQDFKALSKAVEMKFTDLSAQERALEKAFQYVKYYFPTYEVPRFFSFFSGFSVQVPLGEGYVGIGLDMFLGADSEFYPALVRTIPRYMSRRFTPENIVPRVVESVLRQELIPQGDQDRNTLQHMLYQGKVLLALDSILPAFPDSLKIGYTTSQLAWANAYQEDIWSWFLQENLLYNTDYLRIQKYFTEAPFTAELGENNESAPKLGSYIGWQMLRRYMERHPTVTLQQLLAMNNAQEILEESKFKGR